MFDWTNQRLWATYHGAPALDQTYGAHAICYNPVNQNLCYAGAAGTGYNGYPFRNFTSPQAYYQDFSYSIGYADAFAGRFSLANGIVGIKENQKNKNDGIGLFIYPNPSNGNVTVSTDSKLSKAINLNVYNNSGQVVYTETVKDLYVNSHTVNLSVLPAGVYYINIISPEINKTVKLIKE